ncbi:protein arginine n-methyltransferase [Stylonychia lemnae]|uniref:type I protein arginine methyltransferase n=1 Tax=Stylonychia lemnae TaxID=5949 RepID=A0A078B1T4_STYLE|nr:protein arginine n-methyltransferase [Stylonychia lemnae]|eukprot:CDW87258.1 protein arginine n-methyltransferase [Stylonychia lemnae]
MAGGKIKTPLSEKKQQNQKMPMSKTKKITKKEPTKSKKADVIEIQENIEVKKNIKVVPEKKKAKVRVVNANRGSPKMLKNVATQKQNKKVKIYEQQQSGETSIEKGFTGGPQNWFKDKEFFQKLCADLKNHNHDYYFGSYSNFYIHEEMLKDTVRTNAYKKAFELNAEYFKDKIVMDIGTGTGILSIFAAKAGAKHVHAVENAEIANFAKEIIRKNGFENVITVHKGKMEEVEIPDEVDIIISEWMGYFLLYEGMLDVVLMARKKFLKQGGLLFPNRGIIYVAAIEDVKFRKSKVDFWNDVYGIDMSCMSSTVLSEPIIDGLDSRQIISSNSLLVDFDFDKMNKKDVNFSRAYSLTFQKTEKCSGIVAWFDTLFSKMKHTVILSTSPYSKLTHWKQTTFYTDRTLEAFKGDTLYGSIAVKQSKGNFRELDVKISYHFRSKHNSKNNEDFEQLYKVR